MDGGGRRIELAAVVFDADCFVDGAVEDFVVVGVDELAIGARGDGVFDERFDFVSEAVIGGQGCFVFLGGSGEHLILPERFEFATGVFKFVEDAPAERGGFVAGESHCDRDESLLRHLIHLSVLTVGVFVGRFDERRLRFSRPNFRLGLFCRGRRQTGYLLGDVAKFGGILI